MPRRTRGKVALALALIAGISGAALFLQKRGPEEAMGTLAYSIETQNWRSLYDLSSETERKLNGWSLNSFQALCSSIVSEMPQRLGKLQFKDVTIDVKTDETLTTENPGASRRFLLFFPNAPEGDNGQKVQTFVGVRRDRDGHFYVDVSYVLLYLNKMAGGSAQEKKERLARALVSAQLEAIVAVDTQKRLTRADLLSEPHATP